MPTSTNKQMDPQGKLIMDIQVMINIYSQMVTAECNRVLINITHI